MHGTGRIGGHILHVNGVTATHFRVPIGSSGAENIPKPFPPERVRQTNVDKAWTCDIRVRNLFLLREASRNHACEITGVQSGLFCEDLWRHLLRRHHVLDPRGFRCNPRSIQTARNGSFVRKSS